MLFLLAAIQLLYSYYIPTIQVLYSYHIATIQRLHKYHIATIQLLYSFNIAIQLLVSSFIAAYLQLYSCIIAVLQLYYSCIIAVQLQLYSSRSSWQPREMIGGKLNHSIFPPPSPLMIRLPVRGFSLKAQICLDETRHSVNLFRQYKVFLKAASTL